MAICIVVFSKADEANQLRARLQNAATTLLKCDLIRPKGYIEFPIREATEKASTNQKKSIEKGYERLVANDQMGKTFKCLIVSSHILN